MLKDVLKLERQKAGMSQADVAKCLKITRQAYNNYETGIREPSFEIINTLAELFGVTVDYLLGREEQNASPLDQQLEGVDFALLDGARNLSEDSKKAVLKYIQFLEQQEKEGK